MPERRFCTKHCMTNYETHRKYYRTHIDRMREKSNEQKQKRIKEGRCRDCGMPLDQEFDAGHRVCMNCRIKCRRPHWVDHGTI